MHILTDLIGNIIGEIYLSDNGHEKSLIAIKNAVKFANSDINDREAIRKFREGWIGEEALSIVLYCS